MEEGTFTAAGIDALATDSPIYDRLAQHQPGHIQPEPSLWARFLAFWGLADE